MIILRKLLVMMLRVMLLWKLVVVTHCLNLCTREQILLKKVMLVKDSLRLTLKQTLCVIEILKRQLLRNVKPMKMLLMKQWELLIKRLNIQQIWLMLEQEELKMKHLKEMIMVKLLATSVKV